LTDLNWARKPSELSSTMLLRWHGLTILIGADVENAQWSEVAAEFSHLH
jgi:hypothetical protein